MRPRENYGAFFAVGLVLTIAIAATFQVYILRETGRIKRDHSKDVELAVEAGGKLYAENCESCHGENGEGITAPALNSRELLKTTPDDVFFSLTRTGIPGTNMPAWGQAIGGPFTDEQISQIVAFMRAWEPDAPRVLIEEVEPDPVRGATLFASACFICHGGEGEGSETAPALNDPSRLEMFDNAWYRTTIANGRPAKGMPTWGTVLSPSQIDDLVALIDAWREGETVRSDISISKRISGALYAIRQFDALDAAFHLGGALGLASDVQTVEINRALELIRENRLYEAEALVISLFPPEEMGKELFQTNCTQCHGDDGKGGTGPNLFENAYIRSHTDEELQGFILEGRKGTAMDGYEGILSQDEIYNLIALLQTWQE
jgi:mono/diheme cytochrome c family protein